jgi:hypothetical protein
MTEHNAAYARVNLFVGKYQGPKDGHIRLDKARVRFMHGRVEAGGWHQRATDETDELWLIVDDGDFWPVMVRLNQAEIAAFLRAAPLHNEVKE